VKRGQREVTQEVSSNVLRAWAPTDFWQTSAGGGRVNRLEPFAAGTEIVWRSRPKGEIGYVFGCRVLVDDPDMVAIVQPTGAPVVRRLGARGGPQGRTLLPDKWNGKRATSVWNQPPVVRLHPVGRSYSVIRTWVAAERRFAGWYVNLEQPWVRTTIGFDSRDDILDVVVSDDLGACRLKDEDELALAVGLAQIAMDDANAIRATATAVITARVQHSRTCSGWPIPLRHASTRRRAERRGGRP
jgi:hypothetical protein